MGWTYHLLYLIHPTPLQFADFSIPCTSNTGKTKLKETSVCKVFVEDLYLRIDGAVGDIGRFTSDVFIVNDMEININSYWKNNILSNIDIAGHYVGHHLIESGGDQDQYQRFHTLNSSRYFTCSWPLSEESL